MPVFTASQLMETACRLLEAVDVPAEEARIIAGSLVESNLRGHDSHGVLQLPRYLREVQEGQVIPRARLEVEREAAGTLLLDGCHSNGHVVGRWATQRAIEKAQTHGTATVAMHRSGHLGRLGAYPEMAAAAHCVAVATVNNHGSGILMAPWGGLDRRLSPNPIAIAAPTGGPFCLSLDMTCSVVAGGKIQVQHQRGEPCPPGWILDAQGRPTTDPAAFFASPGGAILPLGGEVAGHKGYGLGFMLDVLAGALSGAGCSGTNQFSHANALFLTVTAIENFVPLEEFTAQVQALIAHVKASPKAEGCSEILVPGEREAREKERRLKEGIGIEEATWKMIEAWARKLGVTEFLPRTNTEATVPLP